MKTEPPKELRKVYRKLLKRVAVTSNKTIREEWLAKLSLPEGLKKTLGQKNWTPLKEDSYHGLALKFASDKDHEVLGKAAMRPKLDALVADNTVDAIMETPKSQSAFCEALLRDILKNPKPYHKVTWEK